MHKKLTLIALIMCIASPTHRTLTNWSVKCCMTLSLATTRIRWSLARIFTLMILTGSVISTFTIMLTFPHWNYIRNIQLRKSISPCVKKTHFVCNFHIHLQLFQEDTCILLGGSEHNTVPELTGKDCSPCRHQYTFDCGMSDDLHIRHLNCSQVLLSLLQKQGHVKIRKHWQQQKKLTNFFTVDISLSFEIWPTSARHSSSWQSVINLAICICYARFNFPARIPAVSRKASLLTGTFSVFLTPLGLRRNWQNKFKSYNGYKDLQNTCGLLSVHW